jgi:hypothetical protein
MRYMWNELEDHKSMKIIFPVLVWRRQFFDSQIVREGTICRYPVSDNLHATFDG